MVSFPNRDLSNRDLSNRDSFRDDTPGADLPEERNLTGLPAAAPRLQAGALRLPAELRSLRASHRHRFHTIEANAGAGGGGLILIICVAQSQGSPCSWGVSYLQRPAPAPVEVERLSFDRLALRQFRQRQGGSLRWLDSSWMLRLCLERALRSLGSAELAANARVERRRLADLHILRASGSLPPLQALLAETRPHPLLHQDLRQLEDLPPLQIG